MSKTPPDNKAPVARNYDLDDLFADSGAARTRDLLGARAIPIDLLAPNPFQPRTVFDQAALNELAASIRAHGILQPLTVRKVGDRYQIGAGERRWQAARRAGLTDVPCIERVMDDSQMRELALVENVMREDLSPLDLARALQQMMEGFGLSARALSDRLGKNHGYVVDKLKIARDPRIAAAVETGVLGATVALEMAEMDDDDARTALLTRAVQGEHIKVKDVQATRLVSVKPTDARDVASRAMPRVSVKPTDAGVQPTQQPALSLSVKPTKDVWVAAEMLRTVQLFRAGDGRALHAPLRAALLADLTALDAADTQGPLPDE